MGSGFWMYSKKPFNPEPLNLKKLSSYFQKKYTSLSPNKCLIKNNLE